MVLDVDLHHRRSIRLKGYDYSQSGVYFVTICVQNRECLLGKVVEGKMMLNEAGRMITKWWCELENKFSTVRLGDHIVMPNHFHGVIGLVGAALRGRPENHRERQSNTKQINAGHPHRGAPTLGDIVDWFKTMTTNNYITGVKQSGWFPFPGRLWQRNYYEHIIRHENEYFRIAEYIQTNPLNWDTDEENPKNHR